jgi:transposase-like protein
MIREYELKRRAERQAETRQRIVEAAVRLHLTKGPARTSSSDVARFAGVQRNTLYRRTAQRRADDAHPLLAGRGAVHGRSVAGGVLRA